MSAPPYRTRDQAPQPQGTALSEFIRPYHAKVVHNSKGYNWEVSVSGEVKDEVLEDVFEMEAKLKQQYGGEAER